MGDADERGGKRADQNRERRRGWIIEGKLREGERVIEKTKSGRKWENAGEAIERTCQLVINGTRSQCWVYPLCTFSSFDFIPVAQFQQRMCSLMTSRQATRF